jgi:hypothetical protein
VNPEQELEALNQLIDELLAGIQESIQNGQYLSYEMQGVIAQELELTLQRVDQLRSEISQQNQPPINPPSNAPISPDAQLLWILSGQQEQAFISYLRDFPSPATQALLNNPTLLSQTIEQLSHLMPQGQQPVIDGIQHSDLNSSNIWGTAYDPKTGKMKVRFQGGSEYEYDGIPANIYRAFEKGNASAKTQGRNQYGQWWVGKNPSMGAALNQYIKQGNFPYRRLR